MGMTTSGTFQDNSVKEEEIIGDLDADYSPVCVFFCEAFHTGLRKGCDSIWSSAVWNFISSISDDDISEPGQSLMYNAWLDLSVYMAQCKEKSLKGILDHLKIWEPEKYTYTSVTLKCLLQLMPEEDYISLQWWFTQYDHR